MFNHSCSNLSRDRKSKMLNGVVKRLISLPQNAASGVALQTVVWFKNKSVILSCLLAWSALLPEFICILEGFFIYGSLSANMDGASVVFPFQRKVSGDLWIPAILQLKRPSCYEEDFACFTYRIDGRRSSEATIL